MKNTKCENNNENCTEVNGYEICENCIKESYDFMSGLSNGDLDFTLDSYRETFKC